MSSSSSTSPAKQVRALSAKKDSIQLQLSAQLSILKANNATLHTPPLVDAQGFPRDDIDVWAVRHARVRVIELRNDLDKVMQEIGTALEAVYDPNAGSGAGLTTDGGSDDAGTLKKSPFAKVGGVSPGSPAAEAGLQREDLVLKFGHLTQTSFTASSLQPLADLVSANENLSVPIEVVRGAETVRLVLTPRKGWGGPGMLGCHVVPYTSS